MSIPKMQMIAFYLALVVGVSTARPDTSDAFILLHSQDKVVVGQTRNVTLKCVSNPRRSAPSPAQVYRIAILKKDTSNQWHAVFDIVSSMSDILLYDKSHASGKIQDDVSKVYSSILWDTAIISTVGLFRCDVYGRDKKFNFLSMSTNTVILGQINTNLTTEEEHAVNIDLFPTGKVLTQEVINLLGKERRQFEDKQQKEFKKYVKMILIQNKAIIPWFERKYQQQFELLKATVKSLKEKYSAKFHHLIKSLKSLETKYNVLQRSLTQQILPAPSAPSVRPASRDSWPDGTYSLPAPFTGCSRSSNWKPGFVKFHAESSDNSYSSVSSNSHLVPYALLSSSENNFVIMNFCSKVKENKGYTPWPEGSYCINMHGRSCPTGFSSGYIKIDDEDTQWQGVYGGDYPDFLIETGGSMYHMYYCCRSDGPAYRSIALPTEEPFFLYRYGGTCQKVKKMKELEEYVIIDTENKYKGDRYENLYHPDGNVKDIKLQLCHYQPAD